MSGLAFVEFDEYGLLNEDESTDLFVSININRESTDGAGVTPTENVLTEAHKKESGNIFESIMEQCEQTASQLGLHPLVVFMLLANQGWNLHRLAEKWLSMSGVLLSQIGVPPERVMEDPSLRHPPESLCPEDGWLCKVCFCPSETEDMWCLPCGHTFCTTCWRGYVESKVSEAVCQPKCMKAGCNCTIPPNSVKDLCEPAIYENLLRFLMDQQVSMADTLTFCPNPQCAKATDLLGMTLCNTIKCSSCRHEFCGECREPSHAPATCTEKQTWEAFTDEQVMQQRLFGKNVKTCPNCKVVIEKNEGCNHMTCRHCRHEFCWLCMKDWRTHPQTFYNCAAYREEDDPFLKKPDNVNRELLAKYHDVFLQRGLKGRLMKEKMGEIASQLAGVIVLEQGLTRGDIEEAVADLLDQQYWANENLRWSQVHLFVVRFESVKHLPIHQQLRAVRSRDSSLPCFEFSVTQLESLYNTIDDEINELKKGGEHSILELVSMTRRLKAYREALLKHCDPFCS